MGLAVFLCRVSSGGCPEAGWIASALLRGCTERRVETFGSALVSYCLNGYQNPANVHLTATGQGCCTHLAPLEGLKTCGEPHALRKSVPLGDF